MHAGAENRPPPRRRDLASGPGAGYKTRMARKETMRAAWFLGDRVLELREVPVPSPAAGEVLLRVLACGVCGTDHHIFEGELTAGVRPPVILGHEIAARVEAAGEGVEGLAPGRFCSVDPVLGCGRCAKCRAGLHNLCPDPVVVGYRVNGGFAQYLLVPAEKAIPLSESAGPAGGVLCETLACVLRGHDRMGFAAGSSALVLGAGTVGLLWAQLLASSPCSRLLQSEIVAFRREKARRLGAEVVIDPGAEDLATAVRRELPEGVDYIIDATGDPRAVEEAFELLAPGGTFLLFGVCPADSRVSFPPHELFQKEARIIGSKMPPGTLDRAARLIESGRIACDQIVTTTVGLEKLAESVEGFNTHRDRHVKIAIDPWA
jgi:L-iditol 2-dehydrogenase